MAQYGPIIRFMGFDTRRKQVHISFYQFDPQSGTQLIKKRNSKSPIFSISIEISLILQ